MKNRNFTGCSAFIGLLVITTQLVLCSEVDDRQNDVPDYDLVGSMWRLEYETPNTGRREYQIIFREGGRLVNTHPNERTPDNDTWRVSGKDVVLMFNDGFAVYTGKLFNRDHMAGEATNRNGGAWEWEAYRIVKQEKK